MYSILLVEDEKIELDTLKNFVDWKGLGLDTVFTARGGRSALEIINAEEPDIVITDISMPGMTGIELVDIIRQEEHPCKVIFLTGYDSFQYAKEAIRLQVEDFLLKPFQIEEVEAAVSKLLVKIKKEESEREMSRLAVGKLLERICAGEITDLDQMAEYSFHRPADQVDVNLLAFRGLSQELMQHFRNSKEILHGFQREQLFFVFLPAVISPSLFLTRSRNLLKDASYQAVCCVDKVKLTALKQAFEEILPCEQDLFYAPDQAVITTADHITRKPYEDRIHSTTRKKVLLEAILAGSEEKAKEYLLNCLSLFEDLDRDGYCQNAFSLFLYLHRELDSIGNLDGPAEVPAILRSETIGEVQNNLLRYTEQCCAACRSKKDESRWSAYVFDFVKSNYMKDCTVEEMAEGINVSPNYLRKKFKEESGMTILEYVTETRLKTAAQLLEDGSMKIKDVSLAVGYPNISYFTQVFSKRFGVTPNEYKKHL